MFILKLLLKIILFPLYLMVCFIRTWVELLSKIGCGIGGRGERSMGSIIIMYVCQKMCRCVAIAVGMSFIAFLISFASVAVGVVLDGVRDKIGGFLAS